MPSQYAPDAVLLEILQERARQAQNSTPYLTATGRPVGFNLDRAAQRLVANPSQALESTQFAVANDYALRSSGLNPDQALRGAPLLRVGGRTFVNQNRGGGQYAGDLNTLSADLSQFLQGQSKVSSLNKGSEGSPVDSRVASANLASVQKTYGDLSFSRGQALLKNLSLLGSSQLDQLVQQTGISVDQLVSFQNTYRGGGTRMQEITGAPALGSESQGERVLRESIQQQQLSNGLFSSQAGAAQEASALATFRASRQAAVAPTLLAGTLDPNKLANSDAVGFYNAGGAGQLQFGQETAGRSAILADLVRAGPSGSPVTQRPVGQTRLGTNRGLVAGVSGYDPANPLRALENPWISNSFGAALGGGATFGV